MNWREIWPVVVLCRHSFHTYCVARSPFWRSLSLRSKEGAGFGRLSDRAIWNNERLGLANPWSKERPLTVPLHLHSVENSNLFLTAGRLRETNSKNQPYTTKKYKQTTGKKSVLSKRHFTFVPFLFSFVLEFFFVVLRWDQLSIFLRSIGLVTVFDAMLTSRGRCEKLQCLYENLLSKNFREKAVLKKNVNCKLKVQSKGLY